MKLPLLPHTVLALTVSLMLLTACGSETQDDPAAAASAEPTAQEPSSEPAGEETPEPRKQAESCDWDKNAVSGAAKAHSDTAGDLKTVIVGSWQHTHFDSGNGYEALSNKDIRYVFPSADRLLYCQHVPGITNHAENAANISWKGNSFAPPGGAPGWEVVAWSDDSMVWINKMDDSKYLLKRR